MIKAACALIITKSEPRRVLLVSRKKDHTSFGLVGGKVDEGESVYDCFIREMLEESGYRQANRMMNPILYSGVCVDERVPDNVYDCTTYLVHFEDLVRVQEPEEGGGILKWFDLTEFASPDFNSNFSQYNKECLKNYLELVNK